MKKVMRELKKWAWLLFDFFIYYPLYGIVKVLGGVVYGVFLMIYWLVGFMIGLFSMGFIDIFEINKRQKKKESDAERWRKMSSL